MKLIITIFCALLAILPAFAQTSEEIVDKNEDVIFTIEHNLSGGIFTPRTNIHLVKKPDGKLGLMFPEKNGIFGDDIPALKQLLASNELYTLRIHTRYGNHSSEPILTSLPAVSCFWMSYVCYLSLINSLFLLYSTVRTAEVRV